MISQRSRYAFKALFHLARAGTARSVPIREIAEEQSIPHAFLEHILRDLRRAGFVDSKRGKVGGYHLVRAPQDLSLAAVLRHVEGPVAPLSCLSRTAYKSCDDCADEAVCVLRRVFAEAFAVTLDVLQERSLADMLANAPLPARFEVVTEVRLKDGAGI